ncbi:LysR family transcriptional regulator [Niabella beijingensis]|uniref:LysR family transcriptional regulator n=1 Tax=Niabella beijingensis TaxID=2872700 RepID=UPI001CC12E86|nr:LysR substrate-binding domain-containing protein [Niabella beijingensis]MBZ4188509.1 LysR family transcriptional regulator [Niabella beijingensis]
MELRHLIYFTTLAEELHFGRAASRLFISQPPLSRQIKELETELGVLLFERNNKRVRLTEAGTYFLSESTALLRQLEKAKIKARQIQDSVAGTFRLGYISATPKSILAAVLKTVQEHYPFLRVNLYETSTQRQLTALESGALDLGIVRSPVLAPQLEKQALLTEPFCLAKPRGLKLTGTGIAEQPFVSFNKEYAPDYHQQFIHCCRQLGFEPHILHECNNMPSILELVANGTGIAIVPASAKRLFHHPELDFKSLPKLGVTTTTLVVFDPQNPQPALPVFLRLLKEAYAGFMPVSK